MNINIIRVTKTSNQLHIDITRTVTKVDWTSYHNFDKGEYQNKQINEFVKW